MRSKINIILGDADEYRRTDDWPYHISCGGVVYRQINKMTEIIILKRGEEMNEMLGREVKETWHLPKGTMHYNETLVEAAIREVREEAGVEVEVSAYIGSRIADWIEQGNHYVKDHHYFLMEYLGETKEGIDHEHESKSWFPIDEARKMLQWDKEAVDAAKIALEKLGKI